GVRRTMRQAVRITGAILLGAGALGLGWALRVWQWQDPVAALDTTLQQSCLAASYNQTFDAYRAPSTPLVNHGADMRAEQRLIALEARAYRRSLKSGKPGGRLRARPTRRRLKPGKPVGRLRVPRLGLSIIVVTGTDETSLEKGPGWYTGTR